MLKNQIFLLLTTFLLLANVTRADTEAENNLVIGLLDGSIHGVSISDARSIWSSNLPGGSLISSSPNLVIPSLEGGVYLFEDVLGLSRVPFNAKQLVAASPLVLEGTYYLGRKNTAIVSVCPKTGQLRSVSLDQCSTNSSETPTHKTEGQDSERLLLLMSEYIVQATHSLSGQLMWNMSFTEFTNQDFSPFPTNPRVFVEEEAAGDDFDFELFADGSTLLMLDSDSEFSWRKEFPAPIVFAYHFRRGETVSLPIKAWLSHSIQSPDRVEETVEDENAIVIDEHNGQVFVRLAHSQPPEKVRPFANLGLDEDGLASSAVAVVADRRLQGSNPVPIDRIFVSPECSSDKLDIFPSCLVGKYTVSGAESTTRLIAGPPLKSRNDSVPAIFPKPDDYLQPFESRQQTETITRPLRESDVSGQVAAILVVFCWMLALLYYLLFVADLSSNGLDTVAEDAPEVRRRSLECEFCDGEEKPRRRSSCVSEELSSTETLRDIFDPQLSRHPSASRAEFPSAEPFSHLSSIVSQSPENIAAKQDVFVPPSALALLKGGPSGTATPTSGGSQQSKSELWKRNTVPEQSEANTSQPFHRPVALTQADVAEWVRRRKEELWEDSWEATPRIVGSMRDNAIKGSLWASSVDGDDEENEDDDNESSGIDFIMNCGLGSPDTLKHDSTTHSLESTPECEKIWKSPLAVIDSKHDSDNTDGVDDDDDEGWSEIEEGDAGDMLSPTLRPGYTEFGSTLQNLVDYSAILEAAVSCDRPSSKTAASQASTATKTEKSSPPRLINSWPSSTRRISPHLGPTSGEESNPNARALSLPASALTRSSSPGFPPSRYSPSPTNFGGKPLSHGAGMYSRQASSVCTESHTTLSSSPQSEMERRTSIASDSAMPMARGSWDLSHTGSGEEDAFDIGRQLSRSLPSDGLSLTENWWGIPENAGSIRRPQLPSTRPLSRYEQDFLELEALGKGGYGSVFKVQNRLDGRHYAVKKIRLDMHDSNSQQRVSREVKTMARLSAHQNVVRYYHAWVEMVSGPAALSCAGDSSFDVSTTMTDSICDSQDDSRPMNILFIQMQLCTHSLRHWLKDSTRVVDLTYIRSAVRQVSQGLLHMHLQGFIHRDIKPDNIFVEDGMMKIGDFGLATQSHQRAAAAAAAAAAASSFIMNREATWEESQEDSAGVGTCTYAAPELLVGNKYDEKVDMFSLGVILFEMLHPFSTAMERIEMLRALRESAEIPPHILSLYPDESEIVRLLVDPCPSRRPSASEILEHPSFKSQDTQLQALETELEVKKHLVTEQSKLIENMKEQHKMLQQRIEQLSLSPGSGPSSSRVDPERHAPISLQFHSDF